MVSSSFSERRARRATVVAWALAGGIAGIVWSIVRVFLDTPGCIYSGTWTGDITDTRLGLCADNFWISGVAWFLLGAATAGVVALILTARRTSARAARKRQDWSNPE